MTPELETKDLETWEREKKKKKNKTEWNNRYLSVMITVKYLYAISIES